MSTAGICKDCKYFKRWDVEPDKVRRMNSKFGSCEKAIDQNPKSKYNSSITFGESDSLIETNKMHMLTEWGDEVEIGVGEDFGCVQYENKA